MKSIKTILLSCLLMAGVTTSCTNEMEEAFQSTESYLKVEAFVDGITRAAIDDTNFFQGDAIGLFVRDTEGNAYTATQSCSNIKATFDGKQWNVASNVPLAKDKEAVVYAYYPYNAYINVVGDSIDIDVTKQEDILYGSATGVTYENQTAKIQFKHALTRVTLAITKGANDVGEGVVKSVSFKNGPKSQLNINGNIDLGISDYVALKGKMCLVNGNIKRVTDVESVVTVTPQLQISETAQNVDVVLIPYYRQGAPSGIYSAVDIVLDIDGYEFSKRIEQFDWERGIQYTYPMTINRTSDYANRPAEKIYMGFDGDNGKPLYWASYNLGASQPYENGGFYGWGDPTGTHTEQWISEYWGNYVSKEEGMQYYGGTNPPSNISGTSYDVARALWGAGWRIPSENEWHKLRDNCTYNQTTQNGANGYLFESKINGNKLFIPFSTERWGNKVFEYVTNESEQGIYWCSTHFYSDMADHIMLTKFQNNYANRVCVGLPIRPVTE